MRILKTGIVHDPCMVLRYLLQTPIGLAHFLDELLHLLKSAHHPRPHLLRLQLQQVVLVTLVPPVVLHQGNINAWRLPVRYCAQGYVSGSELDPDLISSVDLGPYSESGSGSRRAKMTHESRKNLEILCFEVLDVLFSELKAFLVTWTLGTSDFDKIS
jgi:hypothetical protein